MGWEGMGWTDLAKVTDKGGGCYCPHSNEVLVSTECREFIDKLRRHGFLRKTLLHVVS